MCSKRVYLFSARLCRKSIKRLFYQFVRMNAMLEPPNLYRSLARGILPSITCDSSLLYLFLCCLISFFFAFRFSFDGRRRRRRRQLNYALGKQFQTPPPPTALFLSLFYCLPPQYFTLYFRNVCSNKFLVGSQSLSFAAGGGELGLSSLACGLR